MRRAALVSGILLCACHPTIDFDLTRSGSLKIPGSPLSTPVSLTVPIPALQNVNVSDVQGFPNGQTAKDRIQSARAKKITLTVTAPQGQTLSFLTSVALSISAPGQPDKEVAHLSPFPAATTADLQLDDLELAPYLKADTFTVTTAIQGTPQQRDVTIEADLDLGVTASVF
jgi:hypothetical protein